MAKKIVSLVLLALVLCVVIATAQAPGITVYGTVNIGSNYGWVSGAVTATCEMTWATATGQGSAGLTSGPFGFYVYPLQAGTNRINLECGGATARATIEN